MWQKLLIILLLIFAGELFVRAFITSPLQTLPDKDLGWVYKPYAEIFQTAEGWATNRLNALGYNDEDIQPSDVRPHFLVLGDSFTEALQVVREKNFCSLTEKRLQEVAIVNAARSGLSPVHYPVIANRITKVVRPDMIILVLTTGDSNDIQSGNFVVLRDHEDNVTQIQLREKRLSRARIILEPLLARSAMATHLVSRLRQLHFDLPFPLVRSVMAVPSKESNDIPDNTVILKLIFSEIQGIAPLRVIYIPDLEYRANNIAKQTKASKRFYNTINKVTYEAGIPFMSALPMLIETYRANGQPPVGFHNSNITSGHLNERGHEAVATALTKLIDFKNR